MGNWGGEEKLMKYHALLSGLTKFEREAGDDRPYLDSVARPEWQRLASLSSREILEVVLDFLNKWKCRIPRTPPVATALSAAFKDTAPLFRALAGRRLEEIDLAGLVRAGQEQIFAARAIHSIFDRLVAVGRRFSHVAAVKTMHMVNRELFVMWDNSILAAHGHRYEPYGWFYAYRFLPAMKDEAAAVIRDYQTVNRATRKTAIQAIEMACGDRKTLAKRLDEYNYARFTL